MNTFIADNPNDPFYSFQTTWDPKSTTPPGVQAALEAWAQSTGGKYDYLANYSANTPPIVDELAASAELPFAAPGATVPEPSTWAMVLLGFSGLGLARYRLKASTWLSLRRIGRAGRTSAEVRFIR